MTVNGLVLQPTGAHISVEELRLCRDFLFYTVIYPTAQGLEKQLHGTVFTYASGLGFDPYHYIKEKKMYM